jgi:acetolactate synthase-1/2/3 large subunit
VARAYGIAAASITASAQIAAGLAECWADPAAPFLLEVAIDPKANAYPKMAFGRPMSEMEPLAKPIDMEGT